MMILVRSILAIVILANLYLLFSVYRKRHSVANLALSLYLIGILGWSTFILVNLIFESPLAVKILFAFGAIVMAAQTWFALIFPVSEAGIKKWKFIPLVIGAFFFFTSFITGAQFNHISVKSGGYTLIDNGFLTLPYAIFCLSFILFSIVVLFIKSRKKSYSIIYHKQLNYLFWGYLLFLPAFLTNVLFSHYLNIYVFNSLGPIWNLFLVSFVLYIINRYSFLGIKTVLQRSLIYTALLTMVIGLYLLSSFVVGLVVEQNTRVSYFIAAAITSVLGIFGVPPIKAFFRDITDKIFFKKAYNYSAALRILSQVISTNLDMINLLNQTTCELNNIMKPQKIMILLRKQKLLFQQGQLDNCTKDCLLDVIDDMIDGPEVVVSYEIEGYLQSDANHNEKRRYTYQKVRDFCIRNDIELAIPLFLEKDAVGILLLGPKKSEDSYNKIDFHLLGTFAFQLAVALEKSRLYELERNYARDLELKVRQRTRKIEKMQEEQKEMMLDIAHGLQTPLTVLRGELETLQIQLPENKKLSNFERSIDHISKFIYDMLNLSRLQTNKDSFLTEKLNLSEIMNDLIEYFEVLCQEKNIIIIPQIEPEIWIMGRKDKVDEIIINIVSNSIKYIANDRKVYITLSKKRSKAEIVIRDTGIGIAADQIEKIFNRFYRVKNKNSQKVQGTGLGLAITKELVIKLDGKIHITSQENKGTETIIEFPIIK